jgi:hypothetical protein
LQCEAVAPAPESAILKWGAKLWAILAKPGVPMMFGRITSVCFRISSALLVLLLACVSHDFPASAADAPSGNAQLLTKEDVEVLLWALRETEGQPALSKPFVASVSPEKAPPKDYSDQATIEAAHITAAATIKAAWIQLIALAGAVIAAIIAYAAATRQVRQLEYEAKARAEAYRSRLVFLVDELRKMAGVERNEASLALDRHRSGTASDELLAAMPYSMPEELTPANWRHHAVLGIDAVRGIHRLHEALKKAIRFNNEMRGKPCTSVSEEPTLGHETETADGGVSFEVDIAVEQHVKVAAELFEAAQNLVAILKQKLPVENRLAHNVPFTFRTEICGMTESSNEAANLHSIEVGYQKAIDLWIQEARLFWTQFNIIVVINVLIITLAYNKSYSVSPAFISPAIGLVLCLAWIAMMQRTRAYFKYWASAVKELECKLPGSQIQTVTRGALYGDGKRVELEIGDEKHTLQIGWMSRVRTVHVSRFIAVVFMSAHGFSLYKAIW